MGIKERTDGCVRLQIYTKNPRNIFCRELFNIIIVIVRRTLKFVGRGKRVRRARKLILVFVGSDLRTGEEECL